jgi:hypothetical protein
VARSRVGRAGYTSMHAVPGMSDSDGVLVWLDSRDGGVAISLLTRVRQHPWGAMDAPMSGWPISGLPGKGEERFEILIRVHGWPHWTADVPVFPGKCRGGCLPPWS